jgi:hypothetical protein
MRGRIRVRVLATAAVITTATLAWGARPALAAGTDYTATFAAVQGLGVAPTLSCGGVWGPDNWSCQTSAPITANGITCQQTTLVNTVAGCVASLTIDPGAWPGQLTCHYSAIDDPDVSVHQCVGNTFGVGTASFSYQPVSGSGGLAISNAIATITDAECTGQGGRATLEASGFLGSTSAFSMQSTITWVGSCMSVSALTWTGMVSVAGV